MQEVFEKIIEKLERLKTPCELGMIENGRYILRDKSIEIVKQEAEKYDNGWVPCSEKLPELRQDVLVTVRYTGFMGMQGYWIKTGHMEAENDWWGDCAGGEVIAWQPLPLPFRDKE